VSYYRLLREVQPTLSVRVGCLLLTPRHFVCIFFRYSKHDAMARTKKLVQNRTPRRPGAARLASSDAFPDLLSHLQALLNKQRERYRKRLKSCQARFSEKAIHESRVETRRLASLLQLLQPFLAPGRFERAQVALKRHLETFEDLRDTHVQLMAVKKLRDGNPAALSLYDYLLRRERRYTRKTRKNISRIKPKRLGDLIDACCKDLKQWQAQCPPKRSRSILLQEIDAAFHRTLQLRNRIDPERTETVHRTRVAFKKFRYMIEMLNASVPLPKGLCDDMHRYQTRMGVIQDNEVLLETYDKFLRKHTVESAAARRFRSLLLRRRKLLVRTYLKDADEVLTFWTDAPQRSNRRLAPETPTTLSHSNGEKP
jgi:CHAD domain-containing protein